MKKDFIRTVSKCATVLMIALAIAIGGGKELRGARARVDDVFTLGTAGDHLSIASDLTMRVETARNLVTVASRHLEPTDPALDALSAAASDLATAKDRDAQYLANERLTDSAIALASAVQSLPSLQDNKKDDGYVRQLMAELNSRNQTISRNEYNKLASEFNDELRGFPQNIYALVGGVSPLRLFTAAQ